MTTMSHLVCLFCVTAGQNGENLGSDEEQIVLFVYLLYDIANNKVSGVSLCLNDASSRTYISFLLHRRYQNLCNCFSFCITCSNLGLLKIMRAININPLSVMLQLVYVRVFFHERVINVWNCVYLILLTLIRFIY